MRPHDDAVSYNSGMISQKSYKSSSIRTTTTTRERLADIERQLEEEVNKRKIAEEAIAELTRKNKNFK